MGGRGLWVAGAKPYNAQSLRVAGAKERALLHLPFVDLESEQVAGLLQRAFIAAMSDAPLNPSTHTRSHAPMGLACGAQAVLSLPLAGPAPCRPAGCACGLRP